VRFSPGEKKGINLEVLKIMPGGVTEEVMIFVKDVQG